MSSGLRTNMDDLKLQDGPRSRYGGSGGSATARQVASDVLSSSSSSGMENDDADPDTEQREQLNGKREGGGSLSDTEPFSGLVPSWIRLPPNWGTWWFVGVLIGRMILWIFVLGYLMQQRDISSAWHRDQFYWAILVSLLIEYPLYVTLAARSHASGTTADVVAARFQGQIIAHVFAFVAFFRSDTAMFARSESGYCAVAIIILLDALCVKILRRLF